MTAEPAAVAQARAEGRPLLVYFHAEWCIACRKLMQQTFADPAVGKVARDYVPLLIDMTLDDSAGTDEIEAREMRLHALQDKYQVRGVPTLLVHDRAGQERHRLVDCIEPKDLVRLLTAPVKAVTDQ